MAGDALLTLAFEVMLEQKNVPAEALIETVREVAMCAGNFGMVGGQVIDLDSEGRQISEEELRKLHAGKTGALFIAAVRSGARLSGAASDELLALTKLPIFWGLLSRSQTISLMSRVMLLRWARQRIVMRKSISPLM